MNLTESIDIQATAEMKVEQCLPGLVLANKNRGGEFVLFGEVGRILIYLQ